MGPVYDGKKAQFFVVRSVEILAVMLALQVPLFIIWRDKRGAHQLGHGTQAKANIFHSLSRQTESCQFGFHFHSAALWWKVLMLDTLNRCPRPSGCLLSTSSSSLELTMPASRHHNKDSSMAKQQRHSNASKVSAIGNGNSNGLRHWHWHWQHPHPKTISKGSAEIERIQANKQHQTQPNEKSERLAASRFTNSRQNTSLFLGTLNADSQNRRRQQQQRADPNPNRKPKTQKQKHCKPKLK